MTAASHEHGVLSYASPDVRTSPPRTVLRIVLAVMKWACGGVLTALRLCVMGLGYAVLGAGIVLRFAFAVIAMILLFLGGLRWEIVKRRTLGGAHWVDAKVLNTMSFVRRQIDRLPPHRNSSGGGGGSVLR
ncbi:MAG TPA: hypothetical protein VGR35_12085 [Tepidisphaeraceae bacterium]|nr:hypothetical protein [Tepidisphaeraceae bacterium]